MIRLLSARLVLLLALPFVPLSPAIAQDLFTGPNPNWVEVIDLPAPTPALLDEATDGVLFLLSDEQIAWQGDEMMTFYRTATLVTDRYGLETAATIQLGFDPVFES
jgi:hypothetical protein